LIEDESEKDKIRKKIDDLNLYNKNMLALNEKFATMEYQIKDYKSKIELLTNMLSSGTQNQDILNQVIKTDGKLDNVSKEITKKLDEVKTTIIKTNNQKLNIFLENVYRSNQALVSKIQTIYHQNDKVNRKAKMALDNSIKIMNERIEECLNRPISSNGQTSNNIQTDIEKIIKESNWNFYKAIQGLYEKESDSYNRKLLEMSTAFLNLAFYPKGGRKPFGNLALFGGTFKRRFFYSKIGGFISNRLKRKRFQRVRVKL